jgi:hypothetical protein
LGTDFIGITGAKGLTVIYSSFWTGALLFMEGVFELTENNNAENFMPQRIKRAHLWKKIFCTRDGTSIDIKQFNHDKSRSK